MEEPANQESSDPPGATPAPVRGVIRGDVGIETAQVWLSAFLIVAVGLAAYLAVWGIPFHGEDQALFADQTALQRVVTVPEALAAMPHAPLTLFGYAVNAWPSPGSPMLLHAFSLLLHLANAVLLFLVARRLLGRGVPEPVAMLGGMLFAVHPIAVESVACLAARPGLQAAFFGLLSLYLFLGAADEPAPRFGHACAALVFYVLAFGSHAAALSLPLAFLATDAARQGREGLRRNFGVHALLLGAMPALALAQHASGVRADAGFPEGVYATLAMQAAFALRLIPGMLWPAGAEVLYPVPSGAPLAVLGLLVLAGLAAATIASLTPLVVAKPSLRGASPRATRQSGPDENHPNNDSPNRISWRSGAGPALAWLFLTACAIPCLTPLDVVLADRQLYLPLAGAVLVVPWLFSRVSSKQLRAAMGVAAAVVVLAGLAVTYQRTTRWADPESLWTEATANAPANPTPWRYLGRYLARQAEAAADPAQRETLLQKAAQAWSAAAQQAPEDPECLAQCGIALQRLGQNEEALPQLQAALRANPFDGPAARHRALACESQANRAPDPEPLRHAFDHFQRAERLGALTPDAQARYGMVCAALGDFDRAVQLLEPIAGEDPAAPPNQILQRFQQLADQGKSLDQTAQKQFSQNATGVDGLVTRAEAMELRGNYLQAGYLLDLVLERHPDNAQAWVLLGLARARTGAAAGFLQEWGGKIAVAPKAWNALAKRCAGMNAWDAALAYLQFSAQKEGAPARAYTALAAIALELRQPQRAETLLKLAADALPEDLGPWLALCDLALAANDTAQAQSHLAEAEKRHAAPEELDKRRATMSPAGGPSQPVRTIIQ
jgi:tetratricopeptide (TPR) repeat protein